MVLPCVAGGACDQHTAYPRLEAAQLVSWHSPWSSQQKASKQLALLGLSFDTGTGVLCAQLHCIQQAGSPKAQNVLPHVVPTQRAPGNDVLLQVVPMQRCPSLVTSATSASFVGCTAACGSHAAPSGARDSCARGQQQGDSVTLYTALETHVSQDLHCPAVNAWDGSLILRPAYSTVCLFHCGHVAALHLVLIAAVLASSSLDSCILKPGLMHPQAWTHASPSLDSCILKLGLMHPQSCTHARFGLADATQSAA
eukprot:1144660-Pelagomonas_calceolata.AAC.8